MAAKSCCIRDIEVTRLQFANVEWSELFLQGSTIFVSTSLLCSAVIKYVGIDGLSSDMERWKLSTDSTWLEYLETSLSVAS